MKLTSVAACLLAVAAVVVGVRNGSKVAGGSDSYGYISQAELWLSGHLSISQPWSGDVPWPNGRLAFIPLAYRTGPGKWIVEPPFPHEARDRWAIVPTYPAGLPLLMAAAKRIAGQCGIFWISPLCGGLMIVATYGLGRRLGAPLVGLGAAWLVATSPTFIMMILSPMSDAPAAGLWAAALWGLLGRSVASGGGAGLAAAIAIMVRPNLAPLGGVLVLHQIIRVWRSTPNDRRREAWRSAAIVAGVGAGVAATMAVFWIFYGSPYRSGYGSSASFSLANVRPNITTYGKWLIDMHTPVVIAGFFALLLPVRRLWGSASPVAVLTLGAFVAVEVFMYLIYDVWEAPQYLRFLLPAWPVIAIGIVMTFAALTRWARVNVARIAAVLAVVAVAWLGVRGLAMAWNTSVFYPGRSENRFVVVALKARAITDEHALILAVQHSGSIRYYAGRMTMGAELGPEWFDRSLTWLTEHGAHPYAVLDEPELTLIRLRLAGQPAAKLFDQPPVFQYASTRFFDLRPGPGPQKPTEMLPTEANLPCVKPAPPPAVPFR